MDDGHAPTAELGHDVVDGASAAAILLLLLEEDVAAAILTELGPSEVKQIGAAMYKSAQASEVEIAAALNRFAEGSRGISVLATDADPRIRSVIARAIGNVRADNILAQIAPQSSNSVLEHLRWMRLDSITDLLRSEHPQVAALIVAVLTPEAAASAIADFAPEVQADLLRRAAGLVTVNAAAIADLETLLAQRGDAASAIGGEIKLEGATGVARVFNSMPRPQGERVLKVMKKHDKALGLAIEEEMFVFEDLADLDPKSLSSVFRAAESDQVAIALRGADEALCERVLSGMSARAADAIRDQMNEAGALKRADVENARKAIVTVARALAEQGAIEISGGGNDYV